MKYAFFRHCSLLQKATLEDYKGSLMYRSYLRPTSLLIQSRAEQ